MFSQLLTTPSSNDNVSIRTFKGPPALITAENAFTIVLLEYSGTIKVNFKTSETEEFAILFLCPDEVVEVPNYKSLKTIVFSGDSTLRNTVGFNFAFGNIHKLFPLSGEAYGELDNFYNKISELITQEAMGFDFEILQALNSMLGLSLAYTGFGFSNNRDYSLVHDFISLVHEHYTMNHQMSFYSKLLNVPSKRITEKFKSLDVMTPHAFIKNRVITEIKRQLLYTNKTVKTICFDVGFNDPAYFARFFKKNEGITATDYRERWKDKIPDEINLD
ncbi:helix-turn-helix domain-containing protein [Aquimarina sp. 2201CG5-10]|uniref:helix-turn-helix domain-containing protein n=1 Tax=Aquimarina callyspongiae TaxID=3098150 RepID=UPI002AB55DA2|nr:helix-turn-helix domain-containing protein [Aquimarina sp. 2201CG5-10]MDY8137069.1 helix-turn-helix domain-containing protein [Aquimarina sp. 2201CG5-10]